MFYRHTNSFQLSLTTILLTPGPFFSLQGLSSSQDSKFHTRHEGTTLALGHAPYPATVTKLGSADLIHRQFPKLGGLRTVSSTITHTLGLRPHSAAITKTRRHKPQSSAVTDTRGHTSYSSGVTETRGLRHLSTARTHRKLPILAKPGRTRDSTEARRPGQPRQQSSKLAIRKSYPNPWAQTTPQTRTGLSHTHTRRQQLDSPDSTATAGTTHTLTLDVIHGIRRRGRNPPPPPPPHTLST
ncbi:hypothetical protein L798_06309 [Zootermopsis nevadensis]|uniref:Uncharacterized protein n=1 Tax=Zootermopsis nevadensis TaxID=136037 RepID=A0A067QF60_ZOONE|nr:hypothetical protein L798_06309 [Zootermopsis nevadensis]